MGLCEFAPTPASLPVLLRLRLQSTLTRLRLNPGPEETRTGNAKGKAFSGSEAACDQANRSVFKPQRSADLDPGSATVHDSIAVTIAGSLGSGGNPLAVVKCVHACACVVSLCSMRSPGSVYSYVNDATRLFKARHTCEGSKAQARSYTGYKIVGHMHLPLRKDGTFTGLPVT